MTKQKKTAKIGRPSRKDKGLLPTKLIGGRVEIDVVDLAIKRFGTLNEALKAAIGRGGEKAV